MSPTDLTMPQSRRDNPYAPLLYGTFRMAPDAGPVPAPDAGLHDTSNPARVPIGQEFWLIGERLWGAAISYSTWLKSASSTTADDDGVEVVWPTTAKSSDGAFERRRSLTVDVTQPVGRFALRLRADLQPPAQEPKPVFSAWRPLTISPAITAVGNAAGGKIRVTGLGFTRDSTEIFIGCAAVDPSTITVAQSAKSLTFSRPVGEPSGAPLRVCVAGVLSEPDVTAVLP